MYNTTQQKIHFVLFTFVSQERQPFADVLKNRCYSKFRINQRKTPVLESLFDKVAGLFTIESPE